MRTQALGPTRAQRGEGVEAHRLTLKMSDGPVLAGKDSSEAITQTVEIQQIANTQPPTGGLVGIGGADATLGGTDSLSTPSRLLQAIKLAMVG